MDKGKRKFVESSGSTGFSHRSSAPNNEAGFDVDKGYEAIGRFFCQAEGMTLPDLKSWVAVINPCFPFSYHELRHSFLKLYEEEKAKVIKIMENLNGLIVLSMDILRRDTTDYYSLELPGRTIFDYLCLRAHFIDDNWESKSWVIYYADIDHIFENGFEKTILKCLSDLHIESKISTITPGDRFKYDEMIGTVKDQLKEKKKLQIKCQPFKIYCCSNLLCQMVEAAFEEIEDIIDKVSRPYQHWHVTLSTLQDAIDLKGKGELSDESDSEFSDLPNEKEWKKLRYVCRLVEYIYNAAELLFFTKDPTATLYLHNLGELQVNLRKESVSPDRLSIATDLLQKFDEYWNDMSLVLAIATVMDPGCKMKYIEFFFFEAW